MTLLSFATIQIHMMREYEQRGWRIYVEVVNVEILISGYLWNLLFLHIFLYSLLISFEI